MKESTLDLHGVRHHEVERLVENFILTNQASVPLTIVCGNSKRMKDLVCSVLNKIKCDAVDHDIPAKIIIYRV